MKTVVNAARDMAKALVECATERVYYRRGYNQAIEDAIGAIRIVYGSTNVLVIGQMKIRAALEKLKEAKEMKLDKSIKGK